MTTTDIDISKGMHIESDPATGAIAASPEPPENKVEDIKETENIKETPVDYRKLAMETIYASRAKVFERELELAAAQGFGATNDVIKEPDDVIKEPDDAEGTLEAQPKVEEKVVELPNQDAPTQKKVVIIDGRPIEFTEEEYARLAERGMYAGQINQAAQQVMQQPTQDTLPKKAEDTQENQTTDVLRDIARRITYGNEEESTKAVADLISAAVQQGGQNQADPRQIAALAAQQAMAQIQFQTNLETIAREYADIYEKRERTLVAADTVNSLRHKYAVLGIPKSDIELYREACNKTRELFGLSSETAPANVQKTATVHSADLGNKLERKRAAPKPLTAATKISSAEQQKPLTGSDIVAKMRKSRGQDAA